MDPPNDKTDRRTFIGEGLRIAGAVGLAGFGLGLAAGKGRTGDTVWQIDPEKCIQCGNCATYCVLDQSAVKCIHSFPICGYCRPCFAYFDTDAAQRADFTTAAENELCPTGAMKRTFIEDPYYEYTIDEDLCIGCGKCVKGCASFGNGSLYLQVCHDLCVNCNECSISMACPAQAYVRLPAESPYLLKHLKNPGRDG